MLVSCRACKKKNDRDISYKVIVNGKNHYYCNEKEYLNEIAERKAKLEVFEICTEILGSTTNTILFKEIAGISSVHTYVKILGYLTDNIEKINGFMAKSFNSEYGKIKYFTTILKNNIGDYVVETKIERFIEAETTEVNYKRKNRKKSLSQYIDEYEGE